MVDKVLTVWYIKQAVSQSTANENLENRRSDSTDNPEISVKSSTRETGGRTGRGACSTDRTYTRIQGGQDAKRLWTPMNEECEAFRVKAGAGPKVDFLKYESTNNSKRVRELRKVDVFLTGKNLNMRVRSWLRMNAGGVLNTCKSNGVLRMKFSDGFFNT